MRIFLTICALLIATLPLAQAQRKVPEPSKAAEGGHGHGGARGAGGGERGENSGEHEKNAYDFELPGPGGKGVPLSEYKGKVVLLVNLGSKSSYNEQLPALIKLSEQFKDKGLVVIGVPSNEFGAAQPGSDAEIQKLYKTDDKVPFPVMALSVLTGDEQLPLLEYLTKGKDAPPGGDVHWNYTKFIIDRKGKVIARLDPDVVPDSAEMLSTLDQIFAGTYKAKPAPDGKPGPGGPPQA
jgi:glutathione peroxidase